MLLQQDKAKKVVETKIYHLRRRLKETETYIIIYVSELVNQSVSESINLFYI